MVGLLRVDQLEHLHGVERVSLAKKAAAFFRMSRSSREHPVLTPQPDELGALITRHTIVATTLIEIGLLDPVPQRLRRHAEILGDLRQRAITGSNKTDRLSTKLRRIRRGNSLTWHKDSSPESVASQR